MFQLHIKRRSAIAAPKYAAPALQLRGSWGIVSYMGGPHLETYRTRNFSSLVEELFELSFLAIFRAVLVSSYSMDGLSAAASGMAVISLALQLAGGFIKLYDFWGTVQDAPQEVNEMLIDLKLLSRILNELVKQKDPSPHVKDTLEHCDTKVELLLSIVREFEPDFSAHSGRVRLWKAFKAARKKQKLKRFRDSLQETKTTLLLALIPQFQMPPIQVDENQSIRTDTATASVDKSKFIWQVEDVSDIDPPPYSQSVDPTIDPKNEPIDHVYAKPDFRKLSTEIPEADIHASIGSAFQLAAESYFKGGAFEKAMTDTIHRVATIQTTYRLSDNKEDSSSDDEEEPVVEISDESSTALTIVPPKSKGRRSNQSRICHRTSATGTLFGTIWMRTTSVQFSSDTRKDLNIVSSFTFFPSWWLTKVGMKYGMEASLFSTPTGWQFNFNPIRAIPDDSPIFKACQQGNVETVRFLLSEGSASVRDTNSKGWTPLHILIAVGVICGGELESNIDLCEFLISEGADKTALAFEGPSENALSPVIVFCATAKRRPADMKIKMLRLFDDCIDMSEPHSEGWKIVEDLVSSFNQESVPATSNSIFWLFRSLKAESMVGFGPKTVWHGLQHAMRTFIEIEQNIIVVKNRLNVLVDGDFPDPYVTAIAYWIVLIVISKKFLVLLLAAGSCLHIEGYDFDYDTEVDPTVLAKQLPFLYETWCQCFTSTLESSIDIFISECDTALKEAGWSKDTLMNFKAAIAGNIIGEQDADRKMQCSVCHSRYSLLGFGLVEPRWIKFIECTTSGHRFDCSCEDFLENYEIGRSCQASPGYESESVKEDSESGEEIFHDAKDDTNDDSQGNEEDEIAWTTKCENLIQRIEAVKGKDPFQAVAIQLYRTQARTWLGTYELGERFCGTCFLKNEGYLDEEVKYDGDFLSSMPASFNQ